MAFTLQEIDEKIKEYTETKEKIETKLKSLLENLEFKKMQNGTDSVEVQNPLQIFTPFLLHPTPFNHTLKHIINPL